MEQRILKAAVFFEMAGLEWMQDNCESAEACDQVWSTLLPLPPQASFGTFAICGGSKRTGNILYPCFDALQH